MPAGFDLTVRKLSNRGRPRVKDDQAAFDGGLNTAADPLHVQPNEFRRAENCLLTSFGAVQKRRGTQRTHFDAFLGLQSGFSWPSLTSAQELLVSAGALYTGTYGIPMLWAPQGGTMDASGPIGFAAYRDASNDVAYLADGGPLNKWDGSTLTENIASTPDVRVLCVQNDRLWGISGLDNILSGSAIGDGDTLGVSGSGGGQFAIATYGGMALVGLAAIGSSLLLFHRSAVSRFTGWTADDFNVLTGTRGVSGDVGTVCASSIVTVDGNDGVSEVLFLSDRGIYSANEGSCKNVSPQIRPLLASLSQAQWANVRAAHYKALYEVRWFIPGLGVLVFNTQLRKWSGPLTGVYTDHAVVTMWPTIDQDAKPIVLTGHDDGYVRRTERPSGVCVDDVLANGMGGNRYALVLKARRLFAGDAVGEKAYRYAWVTCDLRTSDHVALIWETDSDSGIQPFPDLPTSGEWDVDGGQWDAEALGGSPPYVWGGVAYDRKRLQLGGHGEWIDLTITDNGRAESIFARVDLRAGYLGER